LVILFWIASSLLKEKKLAVDVLLVFSISVALLAIGMLLNLPGFSQMATGVDGSRQTVAGYNPNVLGSMMALAATVLVGLVLSGPVTRLISQGALMVLTLPMLAALVATGSRGGMAVFLIAGATYLLPIRGSRRRLTAVTLAACAMLAMLIFVMQNPTATTRWQMTFEEGHTSGRDSIFSSASDMFLESPFLGWKPIEFQSELGRRLGVIFGQKDAHNLFFHLILEVGAVGTVPFLVGLGLCARSSWRARTGSFGLLPLSLFIGALAANLSGTDLALKQFWIMLAFAEASGGGAPSRHNTRSGTVTARPHLSNREK
jgi:O-antigen ligase